MRLFFLLIAVPLLAFGLERPQADLNGYIADYQRPVLFAGDTLRAGWLGPSHYTFPDPASSSPTCSGASGVDTGEYWIRDLAGLVQLESGSLGYSVYWICPGDYRSAAGQTLNLADSGSGPADGQVVKVLCYSSDFTKNPVQRNPNYRNNPNGNPSDPWHDFTDECVLPKINTAGHDYWFFSGVTVGHLNWSTSKLIRIVHGSVGVIFDRTWAACYRGEPGSLTNTAFSCVLFERTLPADNPQSDSWVQNSVVGPCSMIFDADVIGVEFEKDSESNRLVNTTILDCGVHTQLGGNATDGQGTDFVVENVDMTVSDHMRIADASCNESAWFATGMKCAQSHGCLAQYTATNATERRIDIGIGGAQRSLMDVNGACSCGQQIMTVKQGSNSAASPAQVIQNRLWGILGQLTRCQGDGTTRGYATVLQEKPKNTIFQNNVYQGRYIFSIASSSPPVASNYENLDIRQNLLVGKIGGDGPLASPRRAIGWSPTHNCPSCVFAFNSTAALSGYGAFTTHETANSGMRWDCNTFRDGTTTDAQSPAGEDNVEIGTANIWSSLTNTLSTSTVAAADQDYTFWTDLQAIPRQITVSDVVPQPSSSYVDNCDVLQPAMDLRGLARTSPTTPGAFTDSSAPLPTEHYVNAGGLEYVDASSNVWKECDAAGSNPCSEIYYVSGGPFSNPDTVTGTPDVPLYQSIVFASPGNSIDGTFAVQNGDYLVRLHFVEVVDTYVSGDRRFNITVEGTLRQSNFDIYDEAGGADAALIKEYSVTVADSEITFTLTPGSAENPVIAAVSIVPDVATDITIPSLSLNNVYAQEQEPIIAAHLNEVCRNDSDWSGICHTIPSSGGVVDCDQLVTTSDTDWTKVENQTGDLVYCIEEGDYRGWADDLAITHGGTIPAPKWLVGVDSSQQFLGSDRSVKIRDLTLSGDNWILAGGVKVEHNAPTCTYGGEHGVYLNGTSNVILNEFGFEGLCPNDGANLAGDPTRRRNIMVNGGSDILIQNIFVDSPYAPNTGCTDSAAMTGCEEGTLAAGVEITNGSTDVRVVKAEILNAPIGIKFAAGAEHVRAVVEDVDIYADLDSVTDCEGNFLTGMPFWQVSTNYALGDQVIPYAVANGYVWEAQGAGVSLASEPYWPNVPSPVNFTPGTITWAPQNVCGVFHTGIQIDRAADSALNAMKLHSNRIGYAYEDTFGVRQADLNRVGNEDTGAEAGAIRIASTADYIEVGQLVPNSYNILANHTRGLVGGDNVTVYQLLTVNQGSYSFGAPSVSLGDDAAVVMGGMDSVVLQYSTDSQSSAWMERDSGTTGADLKCNVGMLSGNQVNTSSPPAGSWVQSFRMGGSTGSYVTTGNKEYPVSAWQAGQAYSRYSYVHSDGYVWEVRAGTVSGTDAPNDYVELPTYLDCGTTYVDNGGMSYQSVFCPYVYYGSSYRQPFQAIVPFAFQHADSPFVGRCN